MGMGAWVSPGQGLIGPSLSCFAQRHIFGAVMISPTWPMNWKSRRLADSELDRQRTKILSVLRGL